MSVSVLLTLLLSYRVVLVSGSSSGAPGAACNDLLPSGHGSSTATPPAPFNLTFSSESYNPGDVLQVTLSGAQFKGFLIAARPDTGQSQTAVDNTGTFTPSNDGKVVCAHPNGNAITHKDPTVKSSVTFNWTAPATPEGDLIFHYTVVRGAPDLRDYYGDLHSVVITGPTPPTVPQGKFAKDPECGKTKGCYSDCVGDVCGWEMSWKDEGANYDFTLKASFTGDSKWMALGFSGNGKMAPASVLVCMTQNGTSEVKGAFNPGYNVQILPNPSEGISNANGSYNNGVLECSFSRVTESNNPKIYNLTDKWFLITARGSVRPDGTLQKHPTHNDRFSTNSAIDLSLPTTDDSFTVQTTTPAHTSQPTQTTPAASQFTKDPDCGQTKGCYSNCKGDTCTLLLAWAKKGNNYEITLKSGFSSPGDYYVALGFSNAAKMHDASVVSCTYVNGVPGVFASFNPDYYNVPLTNPKEGLSSFTGSYNNGVLQCTFLREVASANNSQIYDLNKEWYLIAARGSASPNGVLAEHASDDAFLTSSKINFADPSVDISAEPLKYPLVKAHASLMAIAWMLSASIGLAMARFFKKQWPDDTLCKVKIWFAIHRGSMVIAFVMGITAFILIFVEVGGYKDIPGETYKKAHPILGIIATSLLFINPFMSLLRCAPNDPKRPIFNYAHWAVGSSAHILAGVTIALGVYLPKAQVDHDLGLICMILYGGWHVLFFIIMTVLDYLSNIQPSKTGAVNDGLPIELTGKGYDLSGLNASASLDQMAKSSNEPPFSSAKKWIFACHVLVLTGLTVFILYLVIEGKN